MSMISILLAILFDLSANCGTQMHSHLVGLLENLGQVQLVNRILESSEFPQGPLA